jgi:DNA-binding NarL/FixJ family response regulator
MGRVAKRVSSPLFIGRQAELGILTDAVLRAGAGDAAVMLVGGEAGIGKTRLIDEVGGRAARDGAIVLQGGCVSLGDGGGLPFAPFVEALRRLPAALADAGSGVDIEALRTPATVELGRLLPEFGTPAGADAQGFARPEWIQARIFEGLLALLRDLAERATVLCILEDLHWADGSTRDLVAFLARNVQAERLVVVGTFRTDELHRRHPLRPWLAEMDRLPRVRRIDLARFGRTELGEQMGAILGGAPEPDLLDAIERRAEGNPFFVEELLAARGGGARAAGLPETLREVLLSRVAALSQDAQRVLGMASVDGRSVEPELLAEVSARPEADLEEPLREALAAQLLVGDPANEERYRFRHALLAEAVYDDLLPSERRRLHAAYAAALDARSVPDGAEGASLLAALAHHATAAHEPVRALGAWIGAARAASKSYAFAASVRAFEHAIELWDAVPADDRPSGIDPVLLHHEASLAAHVGGRPDRAVEMARVAVTLVDPVREPERWAAVNERLARASWASGATEDGTGILEATAVAMERAGPSPERARVLASLAGMYMLRGDHARAIPAAEAAIELARSTDAPLAEAHAMNTLGCSTALLGRCADGVPILRAAFARTQASGDVHDMGRAYAILSSVLLTCGGLEESLEVAEAGATWSRSVGTYGQYGRFLSGNVIEASIDLGRWDEVEQLADELLNDETFGVNRVSIITASGTFLVRRGRGADAAPLLAEGRALVAPMRDAQFTGPTYVGLVELALTVGNAATAAATATEGLDRLAHTGDHYYAIELAATAARAEADVAGVARARRDEASAAEAAERARNATAFLERVRDELPGAEAFGGRLESMIALAAAERARAAGVPDPGAWRAAVAASDRARIAWPMAYTRFRVAESLLEARAPRRDSVAALAAAHAAAERLGAAPLRGWIDGLARRARVRIPDLGTDAVDGDAGTEKTRSGPAPVATSAADDLGLTRREREVLPLVAAGHTNKRIAELLFISENTAGVHVSNILGKLGVATRTEAAAIAARLGLDRAGT